MRPECKHKHVKSRPKAISEPTSLPSRYGLGNKLSFRKSIEKYRMFTEVSETWVRINNVLRFHRTYDTLLTVVFKIVNTSAFKAP